MVKNYLKVAMRGLLKNKSAAFINIAGLSIGLACFIMIFLYVQKELSYDTFHPNASNKYRLTTIDEALGISSNNVAITNPYMPIGALEELPEVINATRMFNQGRTRMQHKEDVVYAEDAKYVESTFFEMFDFGLRNAASIEKFNAPRKLIMSEALAEKTFKAEDPIGKSFQIDSEDWEVVGLFDNNTGQSHLKLDLLLSMYPVDADSSLAQYLNSWQGLGMIGYVELTEGADVATVETKLKELATKNEVPEFWIPKLQALEDIHLKSSNILFDGHNEGKGDIVYVYSLSAIAVFVILIAAFNFMNLSTAKSSTRAKEVGIRKVMGSPKSSLIVQHLGESILISLMALVVALILVSIATNFANLGLGTHVLSYIISSPMVALAILGITLVIGIVSGLYPAFVLSHYNPVVTLRGKFQTSKSGIWLRKVLVVAQFTASITLIICTVLITFQLKFLKNKDLGFEKAQVVNFQLNDPGLGEQVEAFKDKIAQYDKVQAAAFSSNMPGRTFGRTGVRPEGVTEEEEPWIVSVMSMNVDYLEVMGMELAEGRNYSEDFGTDQEEAIIVNEAFIREVGWDEGIGKKVSLGNNNQERTIVGVVKDFHFASMRHAIEPVMLFYNPGANSNLSVRITDDISGTMSNIAGVWNEIYPDYPFEYEFFDEEFDQIFKSDEDFSTLAMNFTWLAIFIACLGLFGLSAYMAEQRRKEIGIRKVLGSKISQVVMLLSKEFILLILIANFIAWPIAYWATNNWLSDFQYRIELLSFSSIMIFIVSGVLALVIGLITVSYQSIAASVANPVDSLRAE